MRPTLVVGVLTYRRPDTLAKLLAALPEQISAASELVSARVLIVDNDAAGSAREVVAAAPGVRYVLEPTPGIAAARHRCLTEAGDADLLAFMDDDELPEPDWLRLMVQTWFDYDRPAGVAGSVLPGYVEPPDDWIVAGGFFVRKRPPTGTPLPGAATSNLLIDLGQVRELGLQFDRRLGLRGGEDTLFTTELVARGRRIVFCREAAVVDQVPADRATRAWVLRRSWHHGGTATYLDLLRADSPAKRIRVRLRRFFGGVGRWFAGQGAALVGLARRDIGRHARGLRMRERGSGMARAALIVLPPEYQR